jgi:GMP synthase-like glutamine amidotransferase
MRCAASSSDIPTMKIGILQCDDVADELQPEFGNYPAMFERLLGGAASNLEFATYRAVDGELPNSVEDCDAYITTGSQHGVNDGLAWVNKLEKFVLELATAKKKYVGICFGHQVMAKALGGVISDQGWGIGMSFNKVDVYKPWMDSSQETLNLIVSHRDQVTELPAGVEVLASSDFCPYYMLQYGSQMMTVQGHPEFSKNYSRALMEKRKNIIPAPRIDDGQASLSADADDRLMARWIINFFNGA